MSKDTALTEIDIAIIERLRVDGRRPYAEIASELNMAPSTVQQRANRLIERGVLKIRGMTNPTKVGTPVVAAVSLTVDGTVIRQVANKAAEFEEISYVVICAGSCDIQLEVACRDNDHLLDLVSELARIEGVKTTETFIYLKIVKNSYEWGYEPTHKENK